MAIIMKSGTEADADASLFVHESVGGGDLVVPAVGLRSRLVVHVGGGPIHALRVASHRRGHAVSMPLQQQ